MAVLLVTAGAAQAERMRVSWYGQHHQGRLTASGERFDRFRLTAAHRTLAFGTVLRVSNPATGAHVLLRVNDRGPYIPGRQLDVTQRAARLLGFERQGVALLDVVTVPR